MADDNNESLDEDDIDIYHNQYLIGFISGDYIVSIVSNVSNGRAVFSEIKVSDFKQKKGEEDMRYVDLDEVNTCPHDKYFEDCDDCIDDKKWCHYESDEVSGCGVKIHEENGRSDGYDPDFFIGTKSFKFCPMCGKETSFYWQKSSYIARQFQLKLEKEERDRLKAEKDRLKNEAISKLQKEELKLRSLIEEQEDIANKVRIELRRLNSSKRRKGWRA